MKSSLCVALFIVALSAATAFGQVRHAPPRPWPASPPRGPSVLTAPPPARPISLPSVPPASYRVPDTRSTYAAPPLMPAQRILPTVSGPRMMPAPGPAEMAARREGERRLQCLVQTNEVRGPAGFSSLAAPLYYRGCVDRNPLLQMAGVNVAAATSVGSGYVAAQGRTPASLIRR